MTSVDEIVETLRGEVARAARVEPESISTGTDLVHDLGLGSVDLLNLVAFVEVTYAITIPDRELVSLTTIGRIASKIREQT